VAHKLVTHCKNCVLTEIFGNIKFSFCFFFFFTPKNWSLLHCCFHVYFNITTWNIQGSFYLNINQLDALNVIMSLFHAPTCFEHMCSSSGGQNCTIQPVVSSHL